MDTQLYHKKISHEKSAKLGTSEIFFLRDFIFKKNLFEKLQY